MEDAANENDQQNQSKAPTGIEGFDVGVAGGLPRGRTSLVIGGPGSGKTIFALQTLVHGARQWGEPGIFVAFEENSRQIFANAASFGWDLPALEKDRLFFLDARMSLDTVMAGQFDLTGMLASLNAKAREMGARRIVFDSMDVLLTFLNDPVLERQEIYRVHDWLVKTGLTGILTARIATAYSAPEERYGFMQFMADCVVLLTHKLEERVALRTMRTIKYRGSSFAENELSMVIGPAGIEVSILEQLDPTYEASTERVSTGVEGLDRMLEGGYYRGSSVLISGAPGTTKSTLCGAFLEAACARGEKALYVSFDEKPGEIIRNMASVGIDLQPYIESGSLRIHSVRAHVGSADYHLMRLRALIAEGEPHCLVIDPLSAMIKAGGDVVALSMIDQLLSLTKVRGITLLLTSLLAENQPEMEATPLAVSTVADTWIHLSYVARAGERNRALTIIKSRGTAHSNQVRELILSDAGVRLTDVYTSGGEVLLGTLRWEKEEEMRAASTRREADLKHKKKHLELAEAEAQARRQAIEREIESLRHEIEQLNEGEVSARTYLGEKHEGIRHRRQGQGETSPPPSSCDELPDSEPPLVDERGEVT
jgi:circadian clock protein KaiC